jgi:hypothetical protein
MMLVSKLLGVNGAVNLFLAMTMKTDKHGAAATRWLVASFGFGRLIAAVFSHHPAGVASALVSYLAEAAWLKQRAPGRPVPRIFWAAMAMAVKLAVDLVRQLRAWPRKFVCLPPTALATSKRVVFVRHGETAFNLSCVTKEGKKRLRPCGGINGDLSTDMKDYLDRGLTDAGKQQAREAGDAVRALVASRGAEVDLVIVSPCERTLETAHCMFPDHSEAGAVPVVAHEQVRERMFRCGTCCAPRHATQARLPARAPAHASCCLTRASACVCCRWVPYTQRLAVDDKVRRHPQVWHLPHAARAGRGFIGSTGH